MKTKSKKWTMPDWMKPYREMLSEWEKPEEYMNCDGRDCNIFTNSPRALMCNSAQSQVQILYKLHKEGFLI